MSFVYVFECDYCWHFYGEEVLDSDEKLYCPECRGEQDVDSDWVEKVEVG